MDKQLKETLSKHLSYLNYSKVVFSPEKYPLADALGIYEDMEVMFIYCEYSDEYISKLVNLKKSLTGDKKLILILPPKEIDNKTIHREFISKVKNYNCMPDAIWHIK